MSDLEQDNYVHPGQRYTRKGLTCGHGMGMSLRDYFAGQALIGLLREEEWMQPSQTAKYSYEMADEMLEARKVKPVQTGEHTQ